MHARATGHGRRGWSVPTIAVGVALSLCGPAEALAGPLARTLDNLGAHQDPLGGGFAVGNGTDPGYTSWAALAVASSGERPADWRVRRGGRASLRDALLAPARGLGVGETARLAIATAALGLDPRVAGGRNIIRDLLLAQGPDGRIGDDASSTAWGLMALTAAGYASTSRAVADARRFLERAQRADGGWSTLDDVAVSAPLTTADAVQALVAAGRVTDAAPSLRRARDFLRTAQNPDGGFPTVVGGQSTALTTAWVALAIKALGDRACRPPWDRAGGPLDLLRRLQGADGGVRNSAVSAGPAVGVTIQAALAFAGTPLPLGAPPVASRPRRAPRVVWREPLGGGRLTGRLVARFADDEGGTGVDTSSVRIRVEGRDVTARASVTPDSITLPADAVPVGSARVRLSLSDRAGNRSVSRWRVVAPDR